MTTLNHSTGGDMSRVLKPKSRPKHLWLLVLQRNNKTHVIPFWYEPDQQFPYPDTEAVMEGLKLEINTKEGDFAFLQEVPPHKLPTASSSKGHGGSPVFLISPPEEATRDE